ncbi:unnamed protein product [Strongylus vulgaris]|uniref:Uncharacterized protein n=1 Tax=Strongylus vulgaris TaxID=40348 RepID=A0A3P7K224_STRVU|nr:unnamed protein product [Strongylus vulgaris]
MSRQGNSPLRGSVHLSTEPRMTVIPPWTLYPYIMAEGSASCEFVAFGLAPSDQIISPDENFTTGLILPPMEFWGTYDTFLRHSKKST